jgi:phosphate uptake regulator
MRSFFSKAQSPMEHINAQVVSMLADARHSFDLACSAVLSSTAVEAVADDIEATDRRINRVELEVRRELVVHVSVQGSADIGQVLGYTLLIKKIERIGDQAKNILDLAVDGVSLAGDGDVDEFRRAQQAISELFGHVTALLLEPSDEAAEAIREKARAIHGVHTERIRELLHSSEPGHYAVPRAILHRYMKRVGANLASVASTLVEPVREPEDDPMETDS